MVSLAIQPFGHACVIVEFIKTFQGVRYYVGWTVVGAQPERRCQKSKSLTIKQSIRFTQYGLP